MNYQRIAQAIDFYTSLGYSWIDTPWIVPGDVAEATFPGTLEHCTLGTLVGSAEQGSIQLMLEGKLYPGYRYVSAGPCFRFGDNGQPGKHPYFFKVELIHFGSQDYAPLLQHAQVFMGGDVVEVPGQGHDLDLNGREIGSYGKREYAGMRWAYGTGLAEPRYSEALRGRRAHRACKEAV